MQDTQQAFDEKLANADRKRSIVIDASNKCSLQCHKCGRQWYMDNKRKIPGETLSLENFTKLTNYYNSFIEFCGQISDITMNPNLKDFLKVTHDKGIPTKVSTAASYRSSDWYIDCFNANRNAEWMFGIDGMPEESHWYRKNQNGEKLFDIMIKGRELGMKIRWQYIIFRYNQNSIEEAKALARQHGIVFELNYSSRWDKNDPYKPIGEEFVKHL